MQVITRCCGGGAAGGSAGTVAVLATPGLKVYWKLDETSGLVAADQSGNGFDGAYTAAGMSIGQPAVMDGTSFLFANSGFFGFNWAGGPNSTVELSGAGIPPQSGNKVSVSMGIRTTQAAAESPVFFTGSGGTTVVPFVGLAMGPGGVVQWSVADNGGVNHDLLGATSIRDGGDHYISGAYDGVTQSIFVDGNLDASAALAITVNPVATGYINVNGRRIGAQIYDHGYTGYADEVSYYAGALTLAQHQAQRSAFG